MADPALALGLLRRDLLRVDRRELPGLALLGVVGLAGVHATYFLAERLLVAWRDRYDPGHGAGGGFNLARLAHGRPWNH